MVENNKLKKIKINSQKLQCNKLILEKSVRVQRRGKTDIFTGFLKTEENKVNF